jgi:hypothetical protein
MQTGGRGTVASHDDPLWHQILLFALIWGVIILFMGVLNVGTRLAVEGGGVLAFVGALWGAWLIGLFVYPSAMVAALLRGVWLRFAPASVRYADWPAVLVGAVSAPLGLLAASSLDDPSVWLGGGDGPLQGIWLMTIINGSVAGFLAHRRTSLRDPRWWVLGLVSVAVGLSSWALLDPSFRPPANA